MKRRTFLQACTATAAAICLPSPWPPKKLRMFLDGKELTHAPIGVWPSGPQTTEELAIYAEGSSITINASKASGDVETSGSVTIRTEEGTLVIKDGEVSCYPVGRCFEWVLTDKGSPARPWVSELLPA